MTIDQGIALTGIVIAVVLALAGFFIAKKVVQRNRQQNQRVSGNSIAIQSARDTNIRDNP
jgi:hypothetical protein